MSFQGTFLACRRTWLFEDERLGQEIKETRGMEA